MIWIGLKCRHSPFCRRSSCVSLFSLLPDDLPVVSKISCQPLVFQFLSTLIVNCWVPKEVDPSQVCSVLGGENPSVTRCCLFGTLSKLTWTPSFQILRSSDTKNIRSYNIFKLTWNEQVTKWKVKRHSQGCWSAHGMWSLIFVPVATQNVEVILAVVLLHRQKGRCLSDF